MFRRRKRLLLFGVAVLSLALILILILSEDMRILDGPILDVLCVYRTNVSCHKPESIDVHVPSLSEQTRMSERSFAARSRLSYNEYRIKGDTELDLSTVKKQSLPERRYNQTNCKAVIGGSTVDTMRARISSMRVRWTPVSPNQYMHMTEDCDNFKWERGYILSPLTKEEAEFPIAFAILLYKDVEQTERLLRAIYRPHNLYCLHVDSKSPNTIFLALLGIANCFTNVIVLRHRTNVTWGTISVLQPEITCMYHMWPNKRWKYFINLTGQEFPLRTNLELVRILQSLNGSNDVMMDKRQSLWEARWHDKNSNIILPNNIQLVKGSMHVVLSRGFVGYVLHDNTAAVLYNYIKVTDIPDETFYPTLNYNPQLRVPGSYQVSDPVDAQRQYLARYKLWKTDNTTCHGKFVRDVCVFGIADLPELTNAPHMFANKFHLGFQHSLDCLEEWHYNRTREQYLTRKL